MRVLLIAPTASYNGLDSNFMSNTDFPSGLAYLASALRNAGHEVFGLNPNNDSTYNSAYEMLYKKIFRSLKDTQPQLIGLGGLCVDYKFFKDAIQIIRALLPDVPIVCGGGIITNDTEFVFRTLHPDFCIVSEAEEAFVRLAEMLESGKRDYDQIDHLGYWKEGTPKFTRQTFEYMDIDKLCFPDYEPFRIEEMFKYSLAGRPLFRYMRTDPRPMTIVTARSCPYRCTFCIHRKWEPKYRARSIENIMQEIGFLYERYHFNILVILDELFVVTKQKFREFCAALIDGRRNFGWDFDWLFQTHAGAALGGEDLKMAKEAGCYFFSYGLESASPKVLASMKKQSRPSQIAEAIKLADAAKLGFGGNFIFGDVAETPETITESMDFFFRYCQGNHIYFSDVQPYPGSALFANCVEKGLVPDKLEFYEHINENTFNMTSMSNALWLPWIKKLGPWSNSFSWEKSADAFCATKELETTANSIAFDSGTSIWNVGAKCPYCTKEVYYREPLDQAARENHGMPFFRTFRCLFSRITRSYRRQKKTNRPFLYNFLDFILKVLRRRYFTFKKELRYFKPKVVSFAVFRKHPIFKFLEPPGARNGRAPLSFTTGCTQCGKRFRVNILEPASQVIPNCSDNMKAALL